MSTDCDHDQAARALYNDVDKQVVRVEMGETPSPRDPATAKVGSGFFVNNGDEVVTNVHVALSGSYTDVITADGKTYHAQLEKLDTANDLALLKVIGIAADPKLAMHPDATPLQPNQDLIAYGHPGGAIDLSASPGYYLKKDDFDKSVVNADQTADLLWIREQAKSSNPTTASEAQAYLDAPRLELIMNIDHGNSGGPAVDTSGHLRAVVADRVSARHSLYIPAEKVEQLLSQPEKTFQFNYQADADGNQHLMSIGRLDGTTAPPIVLSMTKSPWHPE